MLNLKTPKEWTAPGQLFAKIGYFGLCALVRKGEIRCVRNGRHIYITEEAAREWLEKGGSPSASIRERPVKTEG